MWDLLRRVHPEFLTRISNIIVIQVVFVFAAVGLIIFFPDAVQEETNYASLQAQLSSAGERLTDALDKSGLSAETSPTDRKARLIVDSLFDSNPTLSHLELYVADEDERFVNVFSVGKDDRQTDSNGAPSRGHPIWQNEVSHILHTGPLRARKGADQHLLIPLVAPDGSTVCFYQFPTGTDRMSALVAVYDRDLFVTNRSSLEYGLLLVFVTSALISLLVAYLLIKRYRNPLRRLIHGFEKTANGELYEISVPETDNDLVRLSGAFNTMSRKLWNNRQQMNQYNDLLKRANETLEESQSFLRTMIDSSPTSVIAVSETGDVTLCNRKMTEATGIESADLLSSPVDELFAKPITPILEELEQSATRSFEAICLRRDGTQFPAFLVATPICSDSGIAHGYLLLMKDITESKNFQEMMIRIDRFCTRGEMAGDIAHEINNHLTVLSGNIELMPLLLKKKNMERIDKKLTLMRETIDRIATFCDGLMDGHHAESQFEQADLNQLIQNVLAFLKPQNKFDFVTIETDLAQDLPVSEFDVGQIQQVLVNLINNAAEALAHQEEPRVICISTSSGSRLGVPGVRVTIHDNGPGVLQDKRSALFVKRFTTKPRGHGIGLVTCRRILTTHNGDISYDFDAGASFQFEIPVHQPTVAPHEIESETVPARSPST